MHPISEAVKLWCLIGCDPNTSTRRCPQTALAAEEVENASLNVPRAMWWSYVFNAIMGTIMLITMLFCIGPLDEAVESDAPYIVLFNNTGSTGVSLLLTILLFILIFSGNVTALATTSRELWAFARDRGFPFSKWISHVSSDSRYLLLFRPAWMLTTVGFVLDEPKMGRPF